jgi:uncharacterized protein (TIGR02466 family)
LEENLIPKKVANIFPTTIVGYDNPNFQTTNKNIIGLLEKEAYTPEPHQPYQTIDNHLELRKEYKELYDWFDLCLEDYRRTFQYHCEKFKIILSWANKADEKGSHRMHVHPNSFVSAVYYLSENPSPTYFEDPRYQIRAGWFVATRHPVADNVWPCPSETGSLVLFPSWLPHYTEAQPFDGLRYTISFNAIPVGATNKGSLVEMNLS